MTKTVTRDISVTVLSLLEDTSGMCNHFSLQREHLKIKSGKLKKEKTVEKVNESQ